MGFWGEFSQVLGGTLYCKVFSFFRFGDRKCRFRDIAIRAILRKIARIAISRKRHFRSPKRKNENTLQYKVPPKTWENSPQKPILAIRKWFFGHCYVQKYFFLTRTPTKYLNSYIFWTGSSRRFWKGRTLVWDSQLHLGCLQHHCAQIKVWSSIVSHQPPRSNLPIDIQIKDELQQIENWTPASDKTIESSTS